ncbi:DUF262 domain-containing protein [Chloroflexota bacterium]
MKTTHRYWEINDLLANIGGVEFPEFQREPTVWKIEKKQRLIDSILRGFNISPIYLYKKSSGKYDCIDGQQRLNAIYSFLGINPADDNNEFDLVIKNEIYQDDDRFQEIDGLKYKTIEQKPELANWVNLIGTFKLSIVEITDIENEEELNLLFLRTQIAAVLNGGEKLNAMTGDMRDTVFFKIRAHTYFDKIGVPKLRFAKEQIAAQIALNEFSLRTTGVFHRSRFIDLQDFFKQYSRFSLEDKKTIQDINKNLDTLVSNFGNKVSYITNRAIAVSVYFCIRELIESKRTDEIKPFVEFTEKFLRTLKWQLPQGVKMHYAYHSLVGFQTNVNQAAGEKTAIQKRHDFLKEYFYFYKEHNKIKGDEVYYEIVHKDPDEERKRVKL